MATFHEAPVSYELAVAAAQPPAYGTLRDQVGLPDLRCLGDEPADDAWPEGGLRFFREGVSSRTTDVVWEGGRVRIAIRALASPGDCELALRIAEVAAGPAGEVETDYFGAVDPVELRRLHDADWMNEQAESGTRALVELIRSRGPMSVPGPLRSCWIGTRLLDELEGGGPPDGLAARIIETVRGVQWDLPAGFRDAAVFVAGGEGDGRRERETGFAVWLPGEDLVIPCVDYVALRAAEGEIVVVPFAAVAALAGDRGRLLDECQLLVRGIEPDAWTGIVERARGLAVRGSR